MRGLLSDPDRDCHRAVGFDNHLRNRGERRCVSAVCRWADCLAYSGSIPVGQGDGRKGRGSHSRRPVRRLVVEPFSKLWLRSPERETRTTLSAFWRTRRHQTRVLKPALVSIDAPPRDWAAPRPCYNAGRLWSLSAAAGPLLPLRLPRRNSPAPTTPCPPPFSPPPARCSAS